MWLHCGCTNGYNRPDRLSGILSMGLSTGALLLGRIVIKKVDRSASPRDRRAFVSPMYIRGTEIEQDRRKGPTDVRVNEAGCCRKEVRSAFGMEGVATWVSGSIRRRSFCRIRSERSNLCLYQPMAGLRERCEPKQEGETSRTVGPNDSNRKNRLGVGAAAP
jgi:hypothetical protein